MLSKYPRIDQFKIAIASDQPGPKGIHSESVEASLGPDRYKLFCKLFGPGQTCGMNGMYPHDVEAVLERMESGRLTGTQLHWD